MPPESKLLEEYDLFQNQKAYYADQESAVIALTGADRASFLHNFCTADIKQLQPSELAEAFILNTKGKTIAFVQVAATTDSLRVIAPKSQSELVYSHLAKYVLVEDVALKVEEVDVVYTMKTTEGAYPTHIAFGIQLSLGSLAEFQQAHPELVAIHQDTFEMVRVENRFPLSGVDVLEVNLAQEFERDQTAISFTKGCYLGQETVARLDALGHTNRAFCLARVVVPAGGEPVEFSDLPLEEQAPLTADDKLCGVVTSASWSPKFEALVVLAMIKKPHHQPTTVLNWGTLQVAVI